MNNTPKPSASSFTNTERASFGETWGTIVTTWEDETRTWLETISLMINNSKPSNSMTNVAKP